MPTVLQHAPYYTAGALAAAAAGVLLAWSLRRHTMISIRNIYLAAAVVIGVDAVALLQRAGWTLVLLAPLTSLLVAASATGRRWLGCR